MTTINAVNNGLSGETGTGNFVGSNSPSLTTPDIGIPSSGTLTNCSGLPISGTTGYGTGVSTALAQSVTGSGGISLSTSPTLVTPVLGTPSSGTLTNCSGLPISTGVSGLGSGVATFLGTPSSANLANALTDETGSGSVVFSTSPTLVTPALGTPSALVLTNAIGDQIGTTTNDNASTGKVREYVSSSILVGSQVALTNATQANITSISLTAGDWDVSGMIVFNPNVTTVATLYKSGISTTSATIPTLASENNASQRSPNGVAGQVDSLNMGQTRISIASTTTVYLVALSNFSTSTMNAYGFIGARRV